MTDFYLPPNPATWSTLDVLKWLRLIEAPQHIERFRTRGITGYALIGLDESALVDLGITDPIERRRMFLEIRLLKTNAVQSDMGLSSQSPSELEMESDGRKGSLLKMRRALKTRTSSGRYNASSSISNLKPIRPGSNRRIELRLKEKDEDNSVSQMSDQLMLDERHKIQSLVANLVNAMDILKSLKKKDGSESDSSSGSDSDDGSDEWEGPTPALYRRQKALNLAGLERREEPETPEMNENNKDPKNRTMFSGILDEEATKKSKKKQRDHWYEVMGPKQRLSAKEIAEQYRMDASFKKLRRGSRILLRSDTQTSLDGDDENDDDLGDDQQPAVVSEWVILPLNRYRLIWDFIIMLLVVYYGLITPVNMAFNDLISNFAMDTTFNCLFIIDIGLNFLTAFRIEKGPRKGQLEVQLSQIRKEYLRQWFWIDLVASVPLDMIFGLAGIGVSASFNKLFRLIRGFKLVRVIKMSRAVKRLTHGHRANPGVARLAKNLLFLIITWHYMGCAYWIVSDFIGFDTEGWTPDPDMHDANATLRYLQAFYWSLAATTSVGKNLEPTDNLQTWFSMVMVVVGVMIMAFVVGASSIALEDMDSGDSEKRARVEAVNALFAEKHDMDGRLKKHILDYYEYTLTRSAGLDLLEDLHTTLKSELNWNLHERLLAKVPMFDKLSHDCLSAIIRELTPKTYLPKEYICLEGERMTMIFFILSGRVAVVDTSSRKQKPLAVLKEGGFFGERCVIDNSRMNQTMQAMCYCDLLLLHKQQVKRIIRYYPEFLPALQSHLYREAKMSHWEKIAFVLNNLRMLHKVGADARFEEMYCKFDFIGKMAKDTQQPINRGSFISRINR